MNLRKRRSARHARELASARYAGRVAAEQQAEANCRFRLEAAAKQQAEHHAVELFRARQEEFLAGYKAGVSDGNTVSA